MAWLPRLLAVALVLSAGVAGATPSPTPENATATPTTVDVDSLLAGIDDSDGDGVPDDHDLAPYHPGIADWSDVDPGGRGIGFGAALLALLAAVGLAFRRS